MRKVWFGVGIATFLVLLAFAAQATVFGTVRGIVHDPQHRPVAGAEVQLKSATSDWSQGAKSDQDGEFTFSAVPLGDYVVTVSQPGFKATQETLTVASGSSPILHFQLALATVNQTTVVVGRADVANVDSVTPATLVDRTDIAQTPGADRSNALQMITDYVPAAYVTHDMLHMRGGHQVEWLIDGVTIPNTNIAANLGPVIDPKDIDYLEVQRGSYDADYGDRTYGIFNVVPRTGFERDRECDLLTTLGNFYQTNDQVSCGAHTQRFAYYASLNGNRTNLGLETPIPQVYHDAANGYGGFTSLMYNLTPNDQLRFVGQLRRDYYQIPYDPNPNDFDNSQWPTSGLRDWDLETDGYALFSWVHTFNPNATLTVSPFYHYNSAGYHSPANDFPVATTAVFSTNYGGGQAVLNYHAPKNDIQAGVYSFAASQDELFNLVFTDESNPSTHETDTVPGDDIALFAADKFSVTSWLTLIGGVRATHFSAGVTENTTYPRIGGTLKIPHVNWVFRAFWGRFYQPPPLVTLSGPLIDLCSATDCTFAPLRGERDEEHQFGVTIPVQKWSLDIDYFETRGVNFLDHNNIGESSVFIPVTFAQSRIRGTELTIRSPRIWNRADVHLAYSNQMAQARGNETGGLVEGPACPVPGVYCALDHDQRNTLNVGFNTSLPWQSYASANVYYGSGFSNGEAGVEGSPYQGPYLPGHTQIDLAVGKTFLERFSVSVNALNVNNNHLLTDNSLTFGGFHYNNPREIYAEFRYRFHY